MEPLAVLALLLGGAAALATALKPPTVKREVPRDTQLVEQLQQLPGDFRVLAAPTHDRLPIRVVIQKDYQGEGRRFALEFQLDPKRQPAKVTTVAYRWPLGRGQTFWFRASFAGPPDGRVLRVSVRPRVPEPGTLVHASTRRALEYLEARCMAPELRSDMRSVRLTVAAHHGSPAMVRLLVAIVWNTAVALDPALVTGREEEEGLMFVAGPQGAGATCQVCGEAASGEMVTCADCATPHHRECWSYMGACSTYGCGSTRVGPRE